MVTEHFHSGAGSVIDSAVPLAANTAVHIAPLTSGPAQNKNASRRCVVVVQCFRIAGFCSPSGHCFESRLRHFCDPMQGRTQGGGVAISQHFADLSSTKHV